jgi:hypothetical protein
MKTAKVFELSRIYAQGWNAANAIPANDLDDFDPAGAAALNPYPADPERARWYAGFREAFGK